MKKNDFAHIHLHTEYSYLDGMTRVWDTAAKEPGELIHRLKEIGQDSCAITDHGSTGGWVRFDKACSKNGIKPIFGVEGYYCGDDRNVKSFSEEEKLRITRGKKGQEARALVREAEAKIGLNRRSHFCAWAMNKNGVYEILNTTSKAYVEGFYYRARWDWELIKEMKNCLFGTACAGGILGWQLVEAVENPDKRKYLKQYYEKAWDEAKKWKKLLCDRLYVELMAIDMDTSVKMNKLYYKIAKDLGIPIVITNDAHYARAKDWEVHDILLAINSTKYDKLDDALNNPKRLRYDAHDLYIKSTEEMYLSFRKRNPDIPKEEVIGALLRTKEVVERCEGKLIKDKMIMPKLNIKKKHNETEKAAMNRILIELVKDGWKRKVVPYVKKELQPEYHLRVQEELTQIIKQNFTPYFILCNDLMHWVDLQGIERGPARGSSCGSLVSYLLDITMVDPIPHKLLFSRFIDPNRTDYPDVDMDFEDRRRREVVDYFVEKYGRDNVAILGTNMVFKARMTLKDVARLYKIPVWEIQKVCNLVIERSGADSRLSFCLEDTLKQFEFAQDFDKKHPEVFKHASKLEGTVKDRGVHAAGVVIADGDIKKYTAVRLDKKQPDAWVTLIDKHDAEDLGLLKMDILGLNTMSIISETKKLVKENYGKEIKLEDLCRDVTYNGGDERVYKEFAEANTAGIFQFQSEGLTRLSKQIKLERFSEISDCTALHRPGPIHCLPWSNFKIQTKDGYFDLKQLYDKKFKIRVFDHKTKNIIWKNGKVYYTGNQKLYRVKTKKGKEIICTKNERFNIGNGKYKKLKNISLGDIVYYI